MRMLKFKLTLEVDDPKRDKRRSKILHKSELRIGVEELINKKYFLSLTPHAVLPVFNKLIEKSRPHRNYNMRLKAKISDFEFSIPFEYSQKVQSLWLLFRATMVEDLIVAAGIEMNGEK